MVYLLKMVDLPMAIWDSVDFVKWAIWDLVKILDMF